jgi:peptidylprolyl isomerase
MKPGGVRELVIPASLAYGSTGQGSIKPNDTLIFVITMVKA